MRIVRAIVATCLLACTAAAAEAPFSFESTPGQLPKTVVPEDYTLDLVPDLKAFTFQGNVSIRVGVRERVNQIVLNALDLEITSASLVASGAAPVAMASSLNPKKQTLALSIGRELEPGAYTLVIAYRGRINPQTFGLYYGRYNTAAGEKIMLATQMEPVDARRMLPCWDEPSFRATFQTTVDLPESWSAYSNMPVELSTPLPGGLKRTRFQRTPKMASYLLVLVAGELEQFETKRDGVRISVVTAAGKRQTAAYAATASGELLHYYNEYFGVPYPLPKLDHLAVPGTAGFGAMENWGGITYSDSILLFDAQTSAPRTRRSIYGVVAHEMAHQWFGNLVTMAWWDNLWLNEGFASWMGTKATARFNPEWGTWLRANSYRENAMNLDARKTTHPIQQPVTDEAGANDAFDSITYNKGLSFLRMLETWLGEEAFRDGIRAYLLKHQYSNTTTADLWAALEQASRKPVRRMAQGWTELPGFPVVKVEARCESNERRITLTQEQFTVDGKPGDTLWAIPVAVAAGGPAAFELLDQRSRVVARPGCSAPVLVDSDAVGYYRVEYSPELLAHLAASWRQLQPDARLKLLSDSWALAGVGRLPLSRYLELVEQARNDTETAIWSEITSQMLKLDLLARAEAVRPQLRAFAVKVLRPRFEALGWEGKPRDSQEVLEQRPRLVSVLGQFGDPSIKGEAEARFTRFLEQPASLPASLVDPVLQIAGRYAHAATYEVLLARLKAATGGEEQSRYLNALTVAEDPKLALRTLELALADSLPTTVRTRIPLLVAVEHQKAAWAFAKQHHQSLRSRLVSLEANYYFGAIVSEAADGKVADELEAWVRKNLPPGAVTETRRIADAIRFDARLKARLLPQLEAALAKPSM